ncbi:MAG: ribosome silencing factor [Aeromicrobium sp.]|nr:MAG: ribosome silencing factor [Aeromicrobium sp.]
MTATDNAVRLARVAAAAANEKKADSIVAFDVSEHLFITDIFLVCSASNAPQMNAVKDEIERKMIEIGAKTIRREGEREGRWVLMDYGDIVVHILHEEERAFYSLERLWSDCPAVDLELA